MQPNTLIQPACVYLVITPVLFSWTTFSICPFQDYPAVLPFIPSVFIFHKSPRFSLSLVCHVFPFFLSC